MRVSARIVVLYGCAMRQIDACVPACHIDFFALTATAFLQVFFWTAVLLAVMLLLATCALCNMDVGRDSLLYAKFITEHNKHD